MKGHSRGLAGLAVLAAALLANAQAPYQPQPASPPRDAGYVTADGTIQIVGWSDLAGMFANLNALYPRTHAGAKFRYVPGNLRAPQHSLIFGETAFAPMGMEFSSNLNSAYRPQVKAPTYAIRIAHGAVAGDAKLSPLAFIVHPSNPVERLSPAQLLHIFTVGGRAPDIVWWKQAGVKGAAGEGEIPRYGPPGSRHYPSGGPGVGLHPFPHQLGLAAQ